MPRRRSTDWVARPALARALASEHRVVALVGPHGSGRSTLLEAWAAERDDVHWVEDGEVPEVTTGFLVVDDAEELSREAWASLTRLMARRRAPSLRIATTTPAVVPGQWDVEWVTDLGFSSEEIAEYLAKVGSSADRTALEFVTGGHPASLRWTATAGTNDVDELHAVLAGRGAHLVLPPEHRQLAVPAHLNAALVERLGGSSNFLDEAEKAGLGWWWGNPTARVFEWLPAVREANRKAGEVSPMQRRGIHATSADVLLRSGAHFASFQAAVSADDLDAADLALKAGGISLVRLHGAALVALLRPFSVVRLRRYPALALALALVYNTRATHRVRAVELLGVALVGARLGAGRPADRALLRIVESAALRVIGVGDGGLKAARKTVQLLQGLEPEERAALGSLEPTLRNHAAISLYYGGAAHEARDQWHSVLGLEADTPAELSALGGLALVDALRGEVNICRTFVEEQLRRPWPPELLDEYAGSLLRIAQAQVAIDDFAFDEAERALDTIWPIVDTIEHWPLMAHMRALIAIARDEAAVGLEKFRALKARRVGRLGTSAPVGSRLAHTEILLLVAAGRLTEARRTTAVLQGNVDHLFLALIDLYAGDHQSALEQLAQSTADGPRERTLRTALKAVVLHHLGQHEHSAERAAALRALVEAHGARTPLLVLPAGAEELFGDLLDGAPRTMRAPVAVPMLTPRELVVLQQMSRTANIREIAAALHVSENTVKSQRRSLYRKLGAGTREEALAAGLVHGLLEG